MAKGKVNQPVIVRTRFVSRRAEEKIKAAGGGKFIIIIKKISDHVNIYIYIFIFSFFFFFFKKISCRTCCLNQMKYQNPSFFFV